MDNLRIPAFTFSDLFAGLGGFHQAARIHGGECVFASEIDSGLRSIYKRNFGIEPHGDIREVTHSAIPEHDILFGGFPCQPFSKAGKQLGWEDAVRGTLFERILEIARNKQPKVLLLENVAHFVRHDSGNTYDKVQSGLKAAGYNVAYKQLSPHQFSVPHIRERIYLIACRRPLDKFEWPEISKKTATDIDQVLDKFPEDRIGLSKRVELCLDLWQEFLELLPSDCKLPSFPVWSMEAFADYPIGRKNIHSFTAKELAKYKGAFGVPLAVQTKKEQIALLPAYARSRSTAFPGWKRSFIMQNRSFFTEHAARLTKWLPKIQALPPSLQKFEWNCQGEERKVRNLIVQFRASGMRVKRRTTAPSLVAMTTTQIPIIPWEGRYMTVRECARLQSMDTLEHLPTGGRAMSALGNAVNVTVVSRIIEAILKDGTLLK